MPGGGGGGGGGAGGGLGGDGGAGVAGVGGTAGVSPGGNGGDSTAFGGGGGGGAGGNGGAHGLSVSGTGFNNLATLTGSDGGDGGDGGSASGAAWDGGGGGGGGAGGYGLYFTVLSPPTDSVNNSVITGGNGGNGGDGGDGNPVLPPTLVYSLGGSGGNGGAGGIGLYIDGAPGLTLTNNGTITGGNGGTGGLGGAGVFTPGAGGGGGQNGLGGAGGVGVVGDGLTIINNGTISGGLADGGAGSRAAAITFLGTNASVLEIRAGSTINGNVLANSIDTLRLGGTTSSSFDLSQVGAAAQYRGFGTLEKTGTSTWTLSGTTTSLLTWKVREGTLDMGGTSQTANGLVLTGGTLSNGTLSSSVDFDVQSGTVSAVLAGSAGLVKTTAGTVTLSAVNTYAGMTTISGGTLKLSGDGEIGDSSKVVLNDAGVFDISATTGGASIKALESTSATSSVALGDRDLTISVAGTTFAGVIGGTGGLVKEGAATFTLTGANTYEGDTLVKAGILQIGSGGTTGSVVSDIKVEGGAGVEFYRSDVRTYAGEISGSGTVKTQGGTLWLTGDSSAFAGTTSVEANSGLMVGLAGIGALGGTTTAKSGAWIGGTGTLGSAVLESGSTLTPGDAPGEIGTLTLEGALTLKSGSTFVVDLGQANVGDKIAVAGAASIEAGASLDVTAHEPFVLGAHYTLLTSSNLTGSFGTVTGDVGALSAFVSADVIYDYDADSVFLDVMQTRAFADAARTRNQIAAARGADSLPLGNSLYTAVAWLPTDAAARNAFDLISGEIHASAKSVLIEDSQFLRNAVFDRLAGASGAAAPGTAVAPLSYGPAVKSPAPFPVKAEPAIAPEPASAVWTQAFGNWGSSDGDGNAATIDRSVGGFFIGADTLVGEVWRLGVVGGYSRSDFDVDARRSSGTADNYHAGIYGGGQWGAFTLRGGVAYTWSDIDTSRAVVFPGFADFLSASYDAGTAQAFGELAYRVGGASTYFEPFAALAYVNLDTDDFVEQGGAAALIASGDSTGTSFTTLGLRAATEFAFGSTSAQLTGLLGWRHAFGDTLPLSNFAFEGGLPFTVAGAPVAEDALVVEAGLNVALSPNVVLGASYTGQFGDGSTLQGAKGTFVWKF